MVAEKELGSEVLKFDLVALKRLAKKDEELQSLISEVPGPTKWGVKQIKEEVRNDGRGNE